MVAGKLPKVAFYDTVNTSLRFGSLGEVDQTSSHPPKPSLGVGPKAKKSLGSLLEKVGQTSSHPPKPRLGVGKV